MPESISPQYGSRRRLPRRDYFLLPLFSLLTVIALFTATELITRQVWAEQTDDPCFIEDPTSGFRFASNCTSRTKNAEGEWVRNRFNECGYRSNTSCLTEPPNSVRIAILGSSVSQGLFIPYEDTFFARAARQLGKDCGKQIDVQNLGVPEASPIYVYRRIAETVVLKPDVVVYLLTPFDLELGMDSQALAQRNDPAYVADKPAAPYKRGLIAEIQRQITGSRTVLVAQHFLFENRDTFLRLYMVYGDKADFLRQPLTPRWQKRFADMDVLITDMAERFHSAGIPLVIMPVPSRAEAAMLSSRRREPHTDPWAFGRLLADMAARHGAVSVNLVDRFGRLPDSDRLFFVVDGHLTKDGQAVLADELVRKLESASIRAFAKCPSATLSMSNKGRS